MASTLARSPLPAAHRTRLNVAVVAVRLADLNAAVGASLQHVVLKNPVLNGPGPNPFDPLLGLFVVCRVDVPTHAAFKIMDDGANDCSLVYVAQLEEPFGEDPFHQSASPWYSPPAAK
jgi:hypothetical protein